MTIYIAPEVSYRGFWIKVEYRNALPMCRATIRRGGSHASVDGDVEADTDDEVMARAKAWVDRIIASEAQ